MTENIKKFPNKSEHQRSLSNRLIEMLGSMRLAITLLVVVAIASVIGTVLQQNQEYNIYVERFGEFWFEVFLLLGLFDVYSSGWFLGIMVFLMISISVCVSRNAPTMIREFNQFRLGIKIKSLKVFKHKRQWSSAKSAERLKSELVELFAIKHIPYRVKEHADYTVISGVRGRYNRLGYMAAHISVVLICIGAIINGNLQLKFLEKTGQIKILKENKKLNEIPETSILQVNQTSSFRGNKNIAEKESYDFIILSLRDGYVLQKLPFHITVNDFRVRYYSTGQPKSFESDLTINDKESKKQFDASTLR